MLGFNVHDGCLEAMVHGYKDGFLRQEEYSSLAQCDSLSDLKSQLQVTDYGNFLQQDGQLTSRVIVQRAQEHLVRQLRELREWAAPPLSQFLDFIVYEHMISNVLKLVIAKRSGRESLELLTKCHPLGWFPELASLTAAADVQEMFQVVLIDSPIGRFFSAEGDFERDLDELPVEYIRGVLVRNYLEQFYDFCRDLGGETAAVMCPLLDFEADRAVLTFAVNTMGLREMQAADRRQLFPNIGSLVDVHGDIAEAEGMEQLRERLRRFADLHELLDDGRGGGGGGGGDAGRQSMERRFVERSVVLYKDAMTRQFQYGVFYAWVKLRELEVSNLQWIADCVVQRMMHRVHEYVNIL
ncbi:vacuolar ATP synthase [Trypanosoma conorhini]|uniref:V-type proton ATPase subunit n=1 Tax=Trypanosoma conorhini TaxID=83891 RepID=A0A422P0V5_9TRYP|nr:vacuolar ATP synthase [Trypanosoma conorhini]RNF11360.1 vacuolar ATP synthase [Trypanosoma conorhini]